MNKKSILVLCILLCTSSSYALDTNDFFNPNPLDDDVILKMPCGFNMVFRKVYTSGSNAKKLDYYEFDDGENNSKSPITQNKYKCRVQGSFHDDKGYYLLVSKYELMMAQYLALSSDKCPTTSTNNKFPAVNLSFNDFLNATSKYSSFLQQQKDVPSSNNQKAFASLPNSCDWAFAARGGLKVKKDDLENSNFTFKDGLANYAWYQGSDSANGKLQLPGLKKSNPLGLYDMLGNAMELMEDRFTVYLNDDSVGQRGGLTVRGGSFLTSKNNISAATRTEKPMFNKKGEPLKAKDIGRRFVLGLPLLTSVKEVQDLNSSINKSSKATNDDKTKKILEQIDKNKEKLKQKEQSLLENEEKLTQKSQLLDEKEQSLMVGQNALEQKEKDLQKRSQALAEKENQLSLKEDELAKRDLKLNNTNKSSQSTNSNIEFKDDDYAQDSSYDTSIVSDDDTFLIDGKTITLDDLNNKNKDAHTQIEARYAPFYFGQELWICGKLVQIKKFNSKVLLNLDDKYPKQNLSIVINKNDFNFYEKQEGSLSENINNKVCVYGKIVQYKDTFEVVLDNINNLKISSLD